MEKYNDFQRYLAAKTSVDDRALNRRVWQVMVDQLPAATEERPLQILELGAGAGAMMQRLRRRGLLDHAVYTAVDAAPENIAVARRQFGAGNETLRLAWETADVFDFAAAQRGRRAWDLMIAHAFLDLLDLATALPALLPLLRPGGICYFTINFDGATILQPAIDPALDAQIEALYHRTMDERRRNGRDAGHSQTGRRLFHRLPAAGATILAAGGSDWVVFPQEGTYAADEAYFLHFIVETMRRALSGRAELEQTAFAAWIEQRHAQIDAGELVYIAHQLDFVGKV